MLPPSCISFWSSSYYKSLAPLSFHMLYFCPERRGERLLTSSNIIIFLCLLIIAFISFYVFAFRIKWREILPPLFTPLVQKIPSYITPNHISIMGFLFVLAAGLFIYLAKDNYFFFLWAALFIFLFALIDSLDGILARIRHRATKSGAFLDYTLDKISYLFLLFTIMLGGHVRAELIVIAMLFTLFYALINMEAKALTGSTFPLAERPRWMALAIILCIVAFLIKLFGAESLHLWSIKIQSFDALFVLLPIYQIVIILFRSITLWKELKKLDRERKK